MLRDHRIDNGPLEESSRANEISSSSDAVKSIAMAGTSESPFSMFTLLTLDDCDFFAADGALRSCIVQTISLSLLESLSQSNCRSGAVKTS